MPRGPADEVTILAAIVSKLDFAHVVLRPFTVESGAPKGCLKFFLSIFHRNCCRDRLVLMGELRLCYFLSREMFGLEYGNQIAVKNEDRRLQVFIDRRSECAGMHESFLHRRNLVVLERLD